jgi:hypothetical protein
MYAPHRQRRLLCGSFIQFRSDCVGCWRESVIAPAARYDIQTMISSVCLVAGQRTPAGSADERRSPQGNLLNMPAMRSDPLRADPIAREFGIDEMLPRRP